LPKTFPFYSQFVVNKSKGSILGRKDIPHYTTTWFRVKGARHGSEHIGGVP
jgi:hypothetical protein